MTNPQSSASDRRTFLRGLGALGGLGLASPWPLTRAKPPQGDPGRVLVLLQLTGGNDGLGTVVPFADDGYQCVRPKLRHAPADVLRLDDYRGFHPRLTRLFDAYQEGRVALIEGVGYPNPNRSHFRSLDIWHAADALGRGRGEGWVGRLMGAAFGGERASERVVHVGANVPYSLHSLRHPALSFVQPHAYRWVGNAEDVGRILHASAAGDARAEATQRVRARMQEAHSSSSRVRDAALRYGSTAPYPDGELAQALRTVAALMRAGLGCRVLSVELGGFDTHADEQHTHTRLMEELDGALGAFLEELGGFEAGRAALTLVFSEFGRRVAENGSRGTDHGTAAPVLIAGHDIRGGLFGSHPCLEELDGHGDLVHTTDFRRVYAELIEACFGVDPEPVLGGRYASIGFA